jgi:hypothetical protein
MGWIWGEKSISTSNRARLVVGSQPSCAMDFRHDRIVVSGIAASALLLAALLEIELHKAQLQTSFQLS